jgi:hypothetical protein
VPDRYCRNRESGWLPEGRLEHDRHFAGTRVRETAVVGEVLPGERTVRDRQLSIKLAVTCRTENSAQHRH